MVIDEHNDNIAVEDDDQHTNVLLPFPESSTTDFDKYFENTIFEEVGETKKQLSVNVFVYHNISFEIDYYEICHSLLDVLVLIYNKMYDSRCTNETMQGYLDKIGSTGQFSRGKWSNLGNAGSRIYFWLEEIDKAIMQCIIEPITEEIEEVAQEQLDEQFYDIMDTLSFEDSVVHPSVDPSFNKLSQKDIQNS